MVYVGKCLLSMRKNKKKILSRKKAGRRRQAEQPSEYIRYLRNYKHDKTTSHRLWKVSPLTKDYYRDFTKAT